MTMVPTATSSHVASFSQLWLDQPLLPVVVIEEYQQPPPQRDLQTTKDGGNLGYQSRYSRNSNDSLFSSEMLMILVLPLLGILVCVCPVVCRRTRRQVQDEQQQQGQQQKTENDEALSKMLRQNILNSITSKNACMVIEEDHLRCIGNNDKTRPESNSSKVRSCMKDDATSHESDSQSKQATMVLTIQEESDKNNYDLEAGGTNQQEIEQKEENYGFLYLPQKEPSQQTAAVSSVCAICLETYQVGDVILCSSSSKSHCRHVFHHTCFVDYAVIKAKTRGSYSSIPCPTCRQGFLDIIKVKEHSMDDKCDDEDTA